MTTLVVEELGATTLEQQFTVTQQTNVYAIRPYLYVHNSPSGTFTISLTTTADVVLSSNTFISTDIYTGLATSDLYAHAWQRIILANPVLLTAGTYKVRFSSSGYTYSSSSFIGWVKEHENLKVDLGYTPTNDLTNPLSYELWGYK